MAEPAPAGQQNALISVYDKTGIEDFVGGLVDLDWTLFSSTGTFARISKAGIPVNDVADLTGYGAMLDHRVVTLHPKVHGGILADTSKPEHLDTLREKEIPLFGLVCVDMYPLEQEIADPNATPESIVEKIDIGGPTMLNGAAKSRRIVLSTAEQRSKVLEWLRDGKPDEEEFLADLAARAFYETTRYYMQIAKHLGGTGVSGFIGKLHAPTKYGENPQQTEAGLYADNRVNVDPLGLDQFEHLKGWELSYVNETDIDRLVQTSTHIAAGFEQNFGEVPAMAIGVKHGNACGAGVAETHAEAVKKMIEGDTRAIFGGVVMINGEIDQEIANILMRHMVAEEADNRLLDGVVGASFTEEALEILKRAKLRAVINPALASLSEASLDTSRRQRHARGGMLTQDNYNFVLDLHADYIEQFGDVTEQQKRDLVLGWAIGSTSNSNTITLVKNGQLLGNGVGQQDRVGAGQLAAARTTVEIPDVVEQNGKLVMMVELDKAKLEGAAAYSDSFFPYPDGPQLLASLGVRSTLTSWNTEHHKEILRNIADQGLGILMLPDKVGRGFFGH